MGCLGECWEVGPPPDSILFLPPPPIPNFLPDLLTSNHSSCVSPQICDLWTLNEHGNGIDYVELPHKDIETWSMGNLNDTWLLVLIASSIGVLLLGALLAMFLLKCREMNVFGSNECSLHNRQLHNHHRVIKTHEQRDCSTMNNKLVHPSETVLYHGGGGGGGDNGNNGNNLHHTDNRMVWAALTPHGTQHFISENYTDYVDVGEDHYETIDQQPTPPIVPPPPHPYNVYNYHKGQSFDNSAFVDYEYEEPIENYQLNHIDNNGREYTLLDGNTDMRCAATFGSLRRNGLPIYRPRVSSPTRIEHPNLPPLNLYPHTMTKKKTNGTMTLLNNGGYRNDTLPKYGC